MTDAIHPAKGIKAILDAVNPAILGAPWHTSLGKLLDLEKSIAVMDNGGRTPEARLSVDYPSVQFLIAGAKGGSGYSEAYAKLRQIRDALVGIPAGPAAMPELTLCIQIGDIFPMGYDTNDRPRFSLNFQLITEPTPTGYRESL